MTCIHVVSWFRLKTLPLGLPRASKMVVRSVSYQKICLGWGARYVYTGRSGRGEVTIGKRLQHAAISYRSFVKQMKQGYRKGKKVRCVFTLYNYNETKWEESYFIPYFTFLNLSIFNDPLVQQTPFPMFSYVSYVLKFSDYNSCHYINVRYYFGIHTLV